MKKQKLDIATRKHHLITLGGMEFSNGFGIKGDCYHCTDGRLADGKPCWICDSHDK